MSTTTASGGSVPAGLKLFNAFAGVTTLGIFMSLRGSASAEGWVSTHNVIAWITVAAALVTAIVALATLRSASAALVGAAVLLVVLLLAEALIGHAMDSVHWLVAVHVPLAMLVFAVTIWISVRGGLVRRRLAAA